MYSRVSGKSDKELTVALKESINPDEFLNIVPSDANINNEMLKVSDELESRMDLSDANSSRRSRSRRKENEDRPMVIGDFADLIERDARTFISLDKSFKPNNSNKNVPQPRVTPLVSETSLKQDSIAKDDADGPYLLKHNVTNLAEALKNIGP